MFDKKDYWENRKNNKRGQGSILKPKLTDESTPGSHQSFSIDGKLILKNRKQNRMKVKNRLYTAKNYKLRLKHRDENGVLINSPHKVTYSDRRPLHPPSLTNNQRMKLKEIGLINKK